MELNEMTKKQRVLFFATAPRATVGVIHQIKDGKLQRYMAGKLRGEIITDEEGQYKFNSREDALNAARDFREWSKSELGRM